MFSGETPSSFVCQGIIDFLVSAHPIARMLRDNIVFKIIPMLNPDGVVLGNYRSSLLGFDLNRHWNEPTAWAHPSIAAAKNLILGLDEVSNVDFFIDIHAHSTLNNSFMYGNLYDDEQRLERQMVFPRLLFNNAGDFSLSNTSLNRDAAKAGTGRRYLGNSLNTAAHCYTLEVSFAGYVTGYGQVTRPYTDDMYHRLGRQVAKTFFDFYKLNPSVLNACLNSSCEEKSTKHVTEDKCKFSSSEDKEEGSGNESNDLHEQQRNSDSSIDSRTSASLRLTHRQTK